MKDPDTYFLIARILSENKYDKQIGRRKGKTGLLHKCSRGENQDHQNA